MSFLQTATLNSVLFKVQHMMNTVQQLSVFSSGSSPAVSAIRLPSLWWVDGWVGGMTESGHLGTMEIIPDRTFSGQYDALQNAYPSFSLLPLLFHLPYIIP